MTDNVALQDFFEEYCKEVEITPEALYGKTRIRTIVEKRMVLMYTLRKSVGMTYDKIASAFKKNRTTIMYGVKTIEDFIEVYPHIQKYYNIAEEILVDHKENFIEFYKSPILSDLQRNIQLVNILIDNNDRLKLKIKQLKKELHDVKN